MELWRFQQYFSYILEISFIGGNSEFGENRRHVNISSLKLLDPGQSY
jgi:hypothetical protein